MDRELLSEQNSSLDCAKYLLKKNGLKRKRIINKGTEKEKKCLINFSHLHGIERGTIQGDQVRGEGVSSLDTYPGIRL